MKSLKYGGVHNYNISFSEYLLPSKPIPIPMQTIAVTGLTVAGKQMYREGKPVPSTSPYVEGLTNFLQFINL
jgi:hypothetical protein